MNDLIEYDPVSVVAVINQERFEAITNASVLNQSVKPEEQIFIYDRFDENSLFAAAVLKFYSEVRVFEYEQIDKIDFSKDAILYWLGFQPAEIVARKIHVKHIAYIPNTTELPVQTSIEIRTGAYESLVHQVIEQIMSIDDEKNEEKLIDVETIMGYGYLINTFQNKSTTTLQSLAMAFAVIKMAFEYLYYQHPWDLKVDETAVQLRYLRAVNETKNLLASGINPNWVLTEGRIVTTRLVNNTDHRWYIIKRLISTCGQIWKVPRVFSDGMFYETNEKHFIGKTKFYLPQSQAA